MKRSASGLTQRTRANTTHHCIAPVASDGTIRKRNPKEPKLKAPLQVRWIILRPRRLTKNERNKIHNINQKRAPLRGTAALASYTIPVPHARLVRGWWRGRGPWLHACLLGGGVGRLLKSGARKLHLPSPCTPRLTKRQQSMIPEQNV